MDTLTPFRLRPAVTSAFKEGDPLWYKDAIIYQLHVKAFYDSNEDGIGDFQGLREKLDYIRDLGINTIWLLPFYPSPMLDDGYDVSDYSGIAPGYGTRQDFRQFVKEAHQRGLKVITELVINHTSDQHPWFQAARRAPKDSSKRDFYVWSDDPNKFSGTRIIFTDTESSNWAWDEVAQSHYWHRFFSHQPDLNFDNPQVLKAILRVMRSWLDMGVDGFRLDAVPYLVEREGSNNENLPETHAIIRKIRQAMDSAYPGRLLLAEANQWPEDVSQYFGDGDECHMAYHFPMMPRLYMSVAMEDRHPLVEIMEQTPEIPPTCQWAIFLRNHDELTLEMVSDRERDYMYQVFAQEPRMRINVGIRRRLAPLMQNSRTQIELVTFLLMTFPGSPILYYGDEIGMGDNVYLGDRNGVRTPMQWSPDRNAGFSRADPQKLYLPPIMDAVYGYQSVNVESQLRSPSSLLHWMRRLIAVRAMHRAFGRGTLTFLRPGNRKILAYYREYEGEVLLCVANLSRTSQAVELDLSRFEKRIPVEIMGNVPFPPIGRLPYLLTLAGHGYFAFRLAVEASAPAWHEEHLPYKALPVVVLKAGWKEALSNGTAKDIRDLAVNVTPNRLRDEIFCPYLQSRRWFSAKKQSVNSLEFPEIAEWTTPEGSWWIAILRITASDSSAQHIFLPLAMDWESRNYDPLETFGAWGIAKVRQKDKIGLAYDAFGNPQFIRALARAMADTPAVQLRGGTLSFVPTSRYPELAAGLEEEVRIPAVEQTNTGAYFGKQLYLKGYRHLHAGVNPELEMGRFLTEISPFPHIAAVAGAVEYHSASGESWTLAVMHQFVGNQGDAWTYTLDYLKRLGAGQVGSAPQNEGIDALYAVLMKTLGTRIGELHAALSRVTGEAAFDPEPVSDQELDGWRSDVLAQLGQTFELLELASIPVDSRQQIDELLGLRQQLTDKVTRIKLPVNGLTKTRYHGDLHLGQLLVTHNDFVIIDFEGEPLRPIAERRRKHSPLRDVAGLLRSLSYAAHAAGADETFAGPGESERLKAAIVGWRADATAAFLSAYRQSAAGLGSVPGQDRDFAALLSLFILEKALYELRYELAHRPNWILIPVLSLLELARDA